MAQQQPVVAIRGLRYAYGNHVVFDDLSLDIMPGRVTAIMGPSGTGKTTLLKLIGGQLRPHAGSIRVLGESVASLDRASLYRLRRRLGMLFQHGALFTDIDVYSNTAFPIREHTALPESVVRHRVLMKLEAVGLRGAAGLMPAELSGGMARRAALARALALDPTLMLYDEPFTGQDPVSTGVLAGLVRDLHDALGMTSIIVSHDVAATCAIADYVYLVADGQVVEHGDVAALQSSTDEWSRQFLDGTVAGAAGFHYPACPFREELLGSVRS